jgi:hypothetical protein
MKVALCFVIHYDHILNKEDLWKEWIEPNQDIINVYVYYKDYHKIRSPWVRQYALPPQYIFETSYYHVIPAYISLMDFACKQDKKNQWFCMLTDSCCPIVSPQRFRSLFHTYFNKSMVRWKPAWWNIHFHKRANLALLPSSWQLANDPWFVMKREDIIRCLSFVKEQKKWTRLICKGGLANESLFAIVLSFYKQLDIRETNNSLVLSAVTHITDWTRMTSATSPHVFREGNERDIHFLRSELEKNPLAMFVRKMAPEFPDYIVREFIYNFSREKETIRYVSR